MGRKILSERNITKILFLIPAVAICSIFMIIPGIMEFFLSLTDWNGISAKYNFIGLRNFKQIFEDRVFYLAIRNTLIYSFLVVILQHTISLALAVMINRGLKGERFYKTILFMPCLLSTIVVSLAFNFIYNPINGQLNFLFKSLGLASIGQTNWLGNPRIALFSIIAVSVWQYVGYCMVIYLAGLKGIQKEIIEAAKVDGANDWHMFRHIEFPSIAPAFTINTVLSIIGTLKAFEVVYAMTGGGPGNATDVIATYVYKVGFTSGRMGYGTAVSLILFLMIVVISFIQVKILKARENAL
ncbi:MAG: carbohydrate ABC transporter permease [Ruminiclostridium sp.]